MSVSLKSTLKRAQNSSRNSYSKSGCISTAAYRRCISEDVVGDVGKLEEPLEEDKGPLFEPAKPPVALLELLLLLLLLLLPAPLDPALVCKLDVLIFMAPLPPVELSSRPEKLVAILLSFDKRRGPELRSNILMGRGLSCGERGVPGSESVPLPESSSPERL